ncbi:MAG: DUF3368 domain-containing protein [Candidatus Wallbacteria bacterium]|nr:DUF3368 domain-containing protein [Candidatus Wallbacteria bacterium]
MPEKVESAVVNTGPLLALGLCDQVELLHRLFGRVLTSEVVIAELGRVSAQGRAPAVPGLPPAWLEVVALERPPDAFLQAYLDDGEAAVIALAQQLGISRVIIDERRGRLAARTMGLAVTGSLGILLRAKRLGFLEAVKPCLDEMQSHGVWLDSQLIRLVLREAGE